MIIAVAIGVVIVFAVFLIITIVSSGGGEVPKDKRAFMEKKLDYLKNAEGISDLKFYPDQNKVVIIYESYKKDKGDFSKTAWYAGRALSVDMGDEIVIVVLCKDSEENVVQSYMFKKGIAYTKKS